MQKPASWPDWQTHLVQYFILLDVSQRNLLKALFLVDGKPLFHQQGHKEYVHQLRNNLIKNSKVFKSNSGKESRTFTPLSRKFNPLLYLLPHKYIGPLTEEQYQSQFQSPSIADQYQDPQLIMPKQKKISLKPKSDQAKKSSKTNEKHVDFDDVTSPTTTLPRKKLFADVTPDFTIDLVANGRSAWPFGALSQLTDHDMVTEDRCSLSSTLIIGLPLMTVCACAELLEFSRLSADGTGIYTIMTDRSPLVNQSVTAFKQRLRDEYQEDCCRSPNEPLGHAKTLDTLRQFLINLGIKPMVVLLRFPDGITCSNDQFQGPVTGKGIQTLLTYKVIKTHVGIFDKEFTETQMTALWMLPVEGQTVPFRAPAPEASMYNFESMKKKAAAANDAKPEYGGYSSSSESSGGGDSDEDSSDSASSMSFDTCEYFMLPFSFCGFLFLQLSIALTICIHTVFPP